MISWAIFQDPRFKELDDAEQLRVFQAVMDSTPEYADLPPEERLSLRSQILGGARLGTPMPKYGERGGWEVGVPVVKGLAKGSLAALGGVTSPFKVVDEGLRRQGWEPTVEMPEGTKPASAIGFTPFAGVPQIEDWLKKRIAPLEEENQGEYPAAVVEGMAAFPGGFLGMFPSLLVTGAAGAALGAGAKALPWISNVGGFAAAEAAPAFAAGEEPENVFLAAAKGGLMGAGFEALKVMPWLKDNPYLQKAAQSLVGAGMFGGGAALEGAEGTDVASAATVGALIPWALPSGKPPEETTAPRPAAEPARPGAEPGAEPRAPGAETAPEAEAPAAEPPPPSGPQTRWLELQSFINSGVELNRVNYAKYVGKGTTFIEDMADLELKGIIEQVPGAKRTWRLKPEAEEAAAPAEPAAEEPVTREEPAIPPAEVAAPETPAPEPAPAPVAEALPPAEPPRAPAEVKQPWEMTREEYVEPLFQTQRTEGISKGYQGPYVRTHEDSVRRRLEKAHDDAVNAAIDQDLHVPIENLPTWRIPLKDYVVHQIERMKKAKNPEAEDPRMIETVKTEHKQEVRFAVEDGRPVPLGVLAEYPDLAPRPTEPAPVEPAAVEPAPALRRVRVPSQPKLGILEVVGEEPGVVIVRNAKGTEFKVGAKTVEDVVEEVPVEPPAIVVNEAPDGGYELTYQKAGKVVAKMDVAKVEGGGFTVGDIWVRDKREGIATALYEKAAEVTGGPRRGGGGGELTPDGRAFVTQLATVRPDIVEPSGIPPATLRAKELLADSTAWKAMTPKERAGFVNSLAPDRPPITAQRLAQKPLSAALTKVFKEHGVLPDDFRTALRARQEPVAPEDIAPAPAEELVAPTEAPVPEPAPIAEAAVKQPWEMTPQEFLGPLGERPLMDGRRRSKSEAEARAIAIRSKLDEHGRLIDEAIKEGKPVPAFNLPLVPEDLAPPPAPEVPAEAIPAAAEGGGEESGGTAKRVPVRPVSTLSEQIVELARAMPPGEEINLHELSRRLQHKSLVDTLRALTEAAEANPDLVVQTTGGKLLRPSATFLEERRQAAIDNADSISAEMARIKEQSVITAPTSEEAEVLEASAKQKPGATGLTKVQAQYLAAKMRSAAEVLPEQSTPSTEAVTIKVPGDGSFRVREKASAEMIAGNLETGKTKGLVTLPTRNALGGAPGPVSAGELAETLQGIESRVRGAEVKQGKGVALGQNLAVDLLDSLDASGQLNSERAASPRRWLGLPAKGEIAKGYVNISGMGRTPIWGLPVQVEGVTALITRRPGEPYHITGPKSGLSMAEGKTVQEAMAQLKTRIETMGGVKKFRDAIKSAESNPEYQSGVAPSPAEAAPAPPLKPRKLRAQDFAQDVEPSVGTYAAEEAYRAEPTSEPFISKNPEVKAKVRAIALRTHPDALKGRPEEDIQRHTEAFKAASDAESRDDIGRLDQIAAILDDPRWTAGEFYDFKRNAWGKPPEVPVGRPETTAPPRQTSRTAPPPPPPAPEPPNLRAVKLPEVVEAVSTISEPFRRQAIKVFPSLGEAHGGTVEGAYVTNTGDVRVLGDVAQGPLVATKDVKASKGTQADFDAWQTATLSLLGLPPEQVIFTRKAGKKGVTFSARQRDESYAPKVIAHEVGHMADRRIVDLRTAMERLIDTPTGSTSPTELGKEIINLSRTWRPGNMNNVYRRKPGELYADLTSAIVNDPAWAGQVAPRTVRAWTELLETDAKLKETYDGLQARIEAGPEAVAAERMARAATMQEEGFEKRAKQLAKPPEPPLLERAKKGYESLRDQLMYKGAVLQDMQRAIKEKGLPAAAHSAADRYEQTLNAEGPRAWQAERMGTLVGDVYRKHNIPQADASAILALASAKNRGARPVFRAGGVQGKEAEIQEAAWRAKYGDAAVDELRAGWNSYFEEVRRPAIDLTEQSGIISAEEAQKWRDDPEYMTTKAQWAIEAGGAAAKVRAKPKQRVGTVRPTGNSILETGLMDQQLLTKSRELIATKAAVEEARTLGWPVEPAKRAEGGGFQEPPANSDLGLVTYYENGKQAGVYVPHRLAEVFKVNPQKINHVVKGLSAVLGALPRGTFVSYNPIFSIWGVPKDVYRTAANVVQTSNPFAAFWESAAETVKAFPEARAWFQGKPGPVAREMLKNGEILPPELPGLRAEDTTGEIGKDLLLESLRNTPKAQRTIKEKILRALSAPTAVGERMTKIAAHRIAARQGMTGPTLAHEVTSMGGTPAFVKRGSNPTLATGVNFAFLFSNVRGQGLSSDYEAFRRDPKGVALKRLTYAIAPKLALLAASAGLMDDDKDGSEEPGTMRKIIDMIPDYYKANYDVIPLGTTANGKAVFVPLPTDQVDAAIGGLFWAATAPLRKEPMKTKRLLEPIMNMLPASPANVNPYGAAAWHTYQLSKGMEPTEIDTGRPILPYGVSDYGSPAEKTTALAKAEWNRLGIPWLMKFSSDDPATITSEWEKTLETPVLGPLLKKFIRVTDQGVSELAREQVREPAKQAQYDRLSAVDKGIRSLLQTNPDPTLTDMAESYQELQAAGVEIKNFSDYKRRVRLILARRDPDVWKREMARMTSKAEREQWAKLHDLWSLVDDEEGGN